MSKAAWGAIKENNTFYVNMFRRGTAALLISLGINLLLIAITIIAYLGKGMPEFYASDGIRLPILLQPLDEPNKSSTYLLPPDPIDEKEDTKIIPN